MSDARQWVIGRAPDCDIVMGQSEVSGKHCRLSRDRGSWIVEDLGSSNGTFVNGRRLTPHTSATVTHGDTVTLGAVPMPWPERPSAPSPQLPKTALAAPPVFDPVARPRSVPAAAAAPKPKSGGAWLGIVGGAAVGAVMLGGLVFLFWQPGDGKDKANESDKTAGKERSEKDRDVKTTAGPLIDEDFVAAHRRGDAMPKFWAGKDVAVVTDEMKRPCLEPTLNGRGMGMVMVPPLSTLKGDFTIEGDAYVNPSLLFVMEGDGPRLAVTIDGSGNVKINDNAPRRPAKMGRTNAFTYKIVRKRATVRVLLNDDLATTAAIEQVTAVSKLQVGLGTLFGNHTRLYSIKVTRD